MHLTGFALFALLLGAGAAAEIDPSLQRGIAELKAGDLDEAVLSLDGLIQAPGTERATLIQAHLYKGAALVGLAQEDAARAAFRQALQLDPKLRLQAGEFSARVIRVFEATRKGKSKSVLYATGGLGVAGVIGAVALAGGVTGAVAASEGTSSLRLVGSDPPSGTTFSRLSRSAVSFEVALRFAGSQPDSIMFLTFAGAPQLCFNAVGRGLLNTTDEQLVRMESLTAEWAHCALPFTSDRILVTTRNGSGVVIVEQTFPLQWTILP